MNWTCPYCDRDQVITSNTTSANLNMSQGAVSTLGQVTLRATAKTCANPTCRRLSLTCELTPSGELRTLHKWSLLPPSQAKPQPAYIPEPLRRDYEEACLIRELSPKSSATLARRCLQGMIRDFCAISKGRLIDEIIELRSRVDSGNAPKGVTHDSVDAIDHVRGIGNIGAHMEKDIDVVVDIDPNEAATLIGLIELLFKEWYVERQQREQRLAELKKIAGNKQAARKGASDGTT